MDTELTIAINGNVYSESQINAMDRASLRTLARILQETKFPDVSRAWIGSMASTEDLRAFVLGRQAGVKNGSNPLPASNGSAADPAGLTMQAMELLAAQAKGGATKEQIDALQNEIIAVENSLTERQDRKTDELARFTTAKVDASEERVVKYVDTLTGALEAKFEELLKNNCHTVAFTVNEVEVARTSGLRHCGFDDLAADVMAFKTTGQTSKANFWLVGPAGTGKTTAAKMLADMLGLPFRFNGAIDSEYKLRGFIDANGHVISTPFRLAYEQGGVYLFDEVDSSLPSACLAFSAALANGCYDFPGTDKPIERHPDCVIMAASNTWGGPSGDYVGRFKQDGAFMDRFMRVPWETDETLESALCHRQDWCQFVQRLRANARKHGIEHIISPRATFNGDVLLDQGRPWDRVVDLCVRKGLCDEDWQKITQLN